MGPVEMSNSEHRRPRVLAQTHFPNPQTKIPFLSTSEVNTKSPGVASPISAESLVPWKVQPARISLRKAPKQYPSISDSEAMSSQGIEFGDGSSPEPEPPGDKSYRSSGIVKPERESSPIMWFSPTPDAPPEKIVYGWKHPTELEYITPADWSNTKIIHFLISNSFDVPPRGNVKSGSPFVNVSGTNGKVTILPIGYRIPLMFLARFQWLSLKLVLTAASKVKEWQEYKFGILHVSRLCKALFDAAHEQSKFESERKLKGMDRKWRCPTFDRVLARYRLKWFLSTPAQLEEFWETYQEEEYEKDALKFDWRRWAIKGHRGFALSEDEVTNGITAQQFMKGLKQKDENWYWETNEGPVPGGVDAWSLRYTAMGVSPPSHDSFEPPVNVSSTPHPPASAPPSANDTSIDQPSTVTLISAITRDANQSVMPTPPPSSSIPTQTQSTAFVPSPSVQTSANRSMLPLSMPMSGNVAQPIVPASRGSAITALIPATQTSSDFSVQSPMPGITFNPTVMTSPPTNTLASTGPATGSTSIPTTQTSTVLPTSQSLMPNSGSSSTSQPSELTSAPVVSSTPPAPVPAGASNSVAPDQSTTFSAQNQATTSTITPATTSTVSAPSPLADRVKSQHLIPSDSNQKENKATDHNTMATTSRSTSTSSIPFFQLQKLVPRKRPGSPLEKQSHGLDSGEKSASVGNKIPTVPAVNLGANIPSSSTDPARISTSDHSSASTSEKTSAGPNPVVSTSTPSTLSIRDSSRTVLDNPTISMPRAASALLPTILSPTSALVPASSATTLNRNSSAPPMTVEATAATSLQTPTPRSQAGAAGSSRSRSSAPPYTNNSTLPLAFSNITKEEAAQLMSAKVWRPLVNELKSQVGSEEISAEEDSRAPEGWMDVDHTENITFSKGGSALLTSNTDPTNLSSNAAIGPSPAISLATSGSAIGATSDNTDAPTDTLPFSQVPMLQHPTFRGPYIPQFYLNPNTRNYGVVPYHAAAGMIPTKPSPLSSLPLHTLHQLAQKATLQLAKPSPTTRAFSTEVRSDVASAQQTQQTQSENPAPPATPVTPTSTPQATSQPETPASIIGDIPPMEAASSGVPPQGVVKIIDSLFTGFAESLRKFSVELRQLKEDALKEVREEIMETAKEEIREGFKQELAGFSNTVLETKIREVVKAELQEVKREIREGNQADVKDGVRVVVATMREEVLRDMRGSFRDVRGDMGRLREREKDMARELDDVRGYLVHGVRHLEEVVTEGMRRGETRRGSREEKGKAVDFGYVRHPLHHLLGGPNPQPTVYDNIEMSVNQTLDTDIIPECPLSDAGDMTGRVDESQQWADYEDGGDHAQMAFATHSEDDSAVIDTLASTSRTEGDVQQFPALLFYMENSSPMPVKSQRKFQKMGIGKAGASSTSTEDEATPAPEDLQ